MRATTYHRAARIVTAAALAAITALAPASVAVAGAAMGGGSARHTLQAGVDDLHGLGITGVQAVVSEGHRATWARAGVRDLRTEAPVPRNGYFRTGSTTKTFAAVIVLQLVEEGELSLGDTVEHWLPGVVSGNGNDGAQITVRQLLQHTSGIYNYTNDLEVFGSADEYYAHRFDHYDPEDLVALAMKHEPEFAPGTSWQYSNTNYILAGMIIERITGRSWPAALQHRIVGPLRLRQTSSPGDRPYLPHPHARGYQQFVDGGRLVDTTLFNPTAAYAAGDIVTTPADLARFWRALQGGKLLGPTQLAEMRRTVPAEAFHEVMPGARYGLGVMWLPSSCGGYWAHGGDVPGMSTVNGVTPSGDRATVVSMSTQLADPDTALAVLDRNLQLVDDTLCGSR